MEPMPFWVTDDQWSVIKPVLDEIDPPAATGRPRVDAREVLEKVITAVFYASKQLDFAIERRSSSYRLLQRWRQREVFDILWPTLLNIYPWLEKRKDVWHGISHSSK